jgi:hypothetical protein
MLIIEWGFIKESTPDKGEFDLSTCKVFENGQVSYDFVQLNSKQLIGRGDLTNMLKRTFRVYCTE